MDPLNSIGKTAKFLKFVALLLILVLIDQVSKAFIASPVLNSGFFLGWLKWTSSFYRVFCTLSFLSLCLLTVSLIQYLVWNTLPKVVLALALIETGLLGNGIDKLVFGGVRDFIPFPFSSTGLFFNIADIYLVLGMAAILLMVWVSPHEIWPKKNSRARFLIFPKSQLKMVSVLVLVANLVGGGLFLLFTSFLNASHIPYSFEEMLLCTVLFLALVTVILIAFGVMWSLRVFGPFKAIERYLKARNDPHGKEVNVRLSDDNECVKEILVLLKKADKN